MNILTINNVVFKHYNSFNIGLLGTYKNKSKLKPHSVMQSKLYLFFGINTNIYNKFSGKHINSIWAKTGYFYKNDITNTFYSCPGLNILFGYCDPNGNDMLELKTVYVVNEQTTELNIDIPEGKTLYLYIFDGDFPILNITYGISAISADDESNRIPNYDFVGLNYLYDGSLAYSRDNIFCDFF